MSNEDKRNTLSAPKGGAFDVTPHDTNDLAIGATAVYVGGAGDMKVDTSLGQTVTFVGLGTGVILPVRVSRIYSTGTTATDIIGLY